MERRSLSVEINGLSRTIRRYLATTMPDNARIATGGNAHIIMFLARNRDRDIVQHDVERRFCITPSTASRVLSLMERKGLVARESVPGDARRKKIVLTDTAEGIVADLYDNAIRMEESLFKGFSLNEREEFEAYLERLRSNIDEAQKRAEESAERTMATREDQ
jgi:DNA-binding MarR family transcriptional regulator